MEYVITNRAGVSIGKKTSNCDCIELNLDSGEIFTLFGDQRQAIIENLRGVVWITQEKDTIDYKISQGERFLVTQPGKVVIQGIPQARIRLLPAEQQSQTIEKEILRERIF